jgi:hypothetical protein
MQLAFYYAQKTLITAWHGNLGYGTPYGVSFMLDKLFDSPGKPRLSTFQSSHAPAKPAGLTYFPPR